MRKVTWRRFDQSAKQLVVGQTTSTFDVPRLNVITKEGWGQTAGLNNCCFVCLFIYLVLINCRGPIVAIIMLCYLFIYYTIVLGMQIYGRKFSTIQQQYQHWNTSLPYHDRVIGRIGLQYRACKNKHVPFLSSFFWNRWRKKIMREPADPGLPGKQLPLKWRWQWSFYTPIWYDTRCSFDVAQKLT